MDNDQDLDVQEAMTRLVRGYVADAIRQQEQAARERERVKEAFEVRWLPWITMLMIGMGLGVIAPLLVQRI